MESALQLFDFLIGKDGYITVLFILLITLLIGIYKNRKKHGNYLLLPGPTGLPIVGYLPFLGTEPHKTFIQLSKKHGPIFKIQIGSISCLVLGNYEILKDAFVKQSDIYSGRDKNFVIKVYEDETAFFFDEGPTFKDVRMFTMDSLKRLGLGRTSLEPLVKGEVQTLIDQFLALNGKAVDVTEFMAISVGNAICSVLCGKRSDYSDQWLIDLIHTVDGLQDTYVQDVTYFFPWIKNIPFVHRFTRLRKRISLKKKLWSLWREKIKEILNEDDGMSTGNNFISAWFAEEKLRKDRADPTFKLYSENNLVNNLDIFSQAAFDTTSTTLLWAFHYLLGHPEKQIKLQQEIDYQIKKKGEELSFTDCKFMSYTRAVIQETHRLSSIVPIVFHCTREESVLRNFKIPKRMIIMANFYAIHHDEMDFPEPFSFKPERFLNDKGEFVHCERVVAFSLGKRFCPGEYVAQMEIFNYLTKILATFDLKYGEGSSYTSAEAIAGNSIIARPKPFQVRFLPRKRVN